MSEILQKISKLENERNSPYSTAQTGARPNRPMEHVQYYSCLNYGHYSRNCPSKVNNSRQETRGDNLRNRREAGMRRDQAQYNNGPQVTKIL